MTALQISHDLALPLDFVTKTCAILAQRRKGKTYTASVLAEEFVDNAVPFVVLDPTGAWWGLRASADGREAGLPVIVLGGSHGQLPLDGSAGRAIADLVLDRPGHYVLDLSLLPDRETEIAFAFAFADQLYRRKAQPGMNFPLHLFVDEADMFAPQERESGDQPMLAAFQAIVRRGGLLGLGTTLISQRPALVNKSVLTQLDMLILLRLVAGNDQDYLDRNYVKRASTVEQRAELMDSLSSLSIGEAWVWEPGADPLLFERVKIRQRRTFNSSATPKAGEQRIEPAVFAEGDIAALAEALAETIEKATADDPVVLRARIAELEKLIAATPVAAPEPVRVPVPVFPAGAIVQMQQTVHDLTANMERVSANLHATVQEAIAKLPKDIVVRDGIQIPVGAAPRQVPPSPTAAGIAVPARKTTAKAPRRPDSALTGPQQRVLNAIAWWHELGNEAPTKLQVGFIAGYRVGKKVGGTYGNILGQLRSEDLIEYPESSTVALQGTGILIAQPTNIERTTAALQQAIKDRLSEPEIRVMTALWTSYPKPMTKKDVGAAAGYTVGDKIGGTFGNILGRLRTLGLVDYLKAGLAVATDVAYVQ